MLFADPPCNMPINCHATGHGRVRHREFAIASCEMTEDEFTAFLRTTFGCLAAQTIDGSIHFVCVDWRHMWETQRAGREVNFEMKDVAVWKARSIAPSTSCCSCGSAGRCRTSTTSSSASRASGRLACNSRFLKMRGDYTWRSARLSTA
jgi:hypothetical protein